MENLMKELDKLNWDMLMDGVTFVRDGEGVSYAVKFTAYNYNFKFVEVVAQNLDSGYEQLNFTRNDINDVAGFIVYFLSAGGEIPEEEVDNWYISK